ncbi:unnamed protein product [Closterium sp. NIES-53]
MTSARPSSMGSRASVCVATIARPPLRHSPYFPLRFPFPLLLLFLLLLLVTSPPSLASDLPCFLHRSFCSHARRTTPEPPSGPPPEVAGCAVFPANNVWNMRVDKLPVHAMSKAYLASIGLDAHVHADFGSGLWDGNPIGIPVNLVSSSTPTTSPTFYYPDESDPGPYPLPASPLVEGGSDHHVLLVDTDRCMLYEIYDYSQLNSQVSAGSGAVWNLTSNKLRPAGWTSADAAGLPILPGLTRFEEVQGGAIRHALRFTASSTQRKYVWPARHYASSNTDRRQPPMGIRVRLKKSFNTSKFPPQARVVLKALQTYGMMLADNGSPWLDDLKRSSRAAVSSSAGAAPTAPAAAAAAVAMPVSPGGTLAPAAIVRLRSAASTFQKLPLGFLPPGGPGAAVVSAATRFIARFGKRDGPKKVRKPRKATRKVRVVGDGDVEGEDDAEEEAEDTEEEATRFSVVGRQVSIVRGQGAAFSLSTSGLGAGLGGGATGAGTGAGAGAGAAMANLFVNLHPRLLLACRSKLLDIGTRLFAPSSSPSTPLSIITLRSALPTPAGPSGPRPFRGAAGLRPHGPAGSTHAHGGSGGGYHQHPRGPSSARSGTPRASGTGGLEATLDDERLGRPGGTGIVRMGGAMGHSHQNHHSPAQSFHHQRHQNQQHHHQQQQHYHHQHHASARLSGARAAALVVPPATGGLASAGSASGAAAAAAAAAAASAGFGSSGGSAHGPFRGGSRAFGGVGRAGEIGGRAGPAGRISGAGAGAASAGAAGAGANWSRAGGGELRRGKGGKGGGGGVMTAAAAAASAAAASATAAVVGVGKAAGGISGGTALAASATNAAAAAAAAEAAAAAVAASARSFAEASVPLAIGALGGDFSRRRPARTVSKFHHGRVGAHSGNHSAAAEAVVQEILALPDPFCYGSSSSSGSGVVTSPSSASCSSSTCSSSSGGDSSSDSSSNCSSEDMQECDVLLSQVLDRWQREQQGQQGQGQQGAGEPTLANWSYIFRELGNRGQWQKTLACFNWLLESPRVKRGGRGGAGDWAKLVSTTIAVLGRHGQVDAARRVFDRARAFGVPPNVYAFSALISAYGRSGRSTDALALLRSMRDAGCLPNLVTYNAAIDACAKAGGAAGAGEAEVARAWALVHEMKELGIAPDRRVEGWERCGDGWGMGAGMVGGWGQGEGRGRAKTKRGGGGWRGGVIEMCSGFYAISMPFRGEFLPDFRAGQWQEALRVFELMGQEACAAATNAAAAAATAGSADSTASASAPAPAAAAAAAGSRGGRKEQQGQSGRRRGKEGGEEEGAAALVRDIFTFNTLIDALCKASQMDAAAAAFASMAQSDVTPNVVTFSTMIDGYRKGNDLSSAINMFHTMQHAGVRPDRVTYNTLLDIYGKAGRLNEAIAVAREMEAAGWRLDVVAHNALLDAYGKAGRCDEVMRLFHAMKRQGLTPNVLTLSAVVTALSRAGRHQEAAALFQQYRDMGLQVDVVVYSAIIDAHGKQGKVEEAMSVFRQMLHDGVQPNVVTYNSLIDALGRSTQVTASSQPSEARGKGGKRREEAGGAKTHEQNAEDAEAAEEEEEEGRREVRLEAALRMFREMKAAGVRPNVVTFSAMLSTCSRLSNWRDAALLLREMGTTFEAAAVPASTATTTTTNTAATATAAASACGGAASSSEASAGVYVLAEAMLHGCVHADAGEREEDEREKESKQVRGEAQNCKTLSSSSSNNSSSVSVSSSSSSGGGGELVKGVRVLSRGEVGQLFAAVAALDSSTSIAFFNALNDLLWRFNQRVQAVRVTRGARRVGVYEGAVWSKAEAQEWVLDLHLMSVGAAMAMLHLWLLDLQQLVLSSHPGSTSAATTSANNAASSSSSSGAGAGGGNSSNPLPRLLNNVVGTSAFKDTGGGISDLIPIPSLPFPSPFPFHLSFPNPLHVLQCADRMGEAQQGGGNKRDQDTGGGVPVCTRLALPLLCIQRGSSQRLRPCCYPLADCSGGERHG